MAEFTADPVCRTLGRIGDCGVAACLHERRSGRVAYCETHQDRWTRDRTVDPRLDGRSAPRGPITVVENIFTAVGASVLHRDRTNICRYTANI